MSFFADRSAAARSRWLTVLGMTLALCVLASSPALLGRARAQGSPNSLPTDLPTLPGVAEAIVVIDRLGAAGVTNLQEHLILFEGALAVGRLPCAGVIRSDVDRGVTIGCLQYGLLGRLQPVLLAMDRAHPDQLTRAFGPRAGDVRAMLNLPTIAAQVAWARSITDDSGNLVGAWPQEFAALAAMPDFQRVYFASTSVRFHRALAWAERYGVRSARGVALMFDLALFRGISGEQEAALTTIMGAAELQGGGEAAELRRLRAFADARSGMEPNPLLRFHLTTIAEGRAVFLGYSLDLAAFGITLDPVGRQE